MTKSIHFKKINSNIEIVINDKKTEIYLDIVSHNDMLFYFEFMESNGIHTFYLIIKINNENVFFGKKALIDFDGQIIYDKQMFNDEKFKTLYEVIKYDNKIKICIDNLLFNGDINDNELLINAYVFEDKGNKIKQIDSKLVKNINLISIQDYYFN